MLNRSLSRYLILSISFTSLIIFVYGFVTEVNIGHPVLYIFLTGALLLKLIKVLFEWYHYAGMGKEKNPKLIKNWKVDIFTTACPEEPLEMIEDTLMAMVKISYPHENYLCDEGNDPVLKKLCNELGVHHITRNNRENAKAGNINNALKQAKGEICVILDPDHKPSPDFLDQVLPHFEDPQVGFVQVVQAYKNQSQSLVARAAAEQTYFFYGPLMRSMSEYGTAQAIGANCTFRREALDSIGGHAPGLTEDMYTSMLLHAKKWKSIYVPKIISRGLVPSSLSAYYKQQLKWSRGTFDLWINKYPKLFTKFSFKQKLHYGLLPMYFLFGFISFINFSVPVFALITGEYPWHMNPEVFFIYFTPFLVCHLLTRIYAYKWLNEPHEKGLHLFGGVLRVGTWWVYIVGFIYTILNIKVPYIPTPKEHDAKNEFLLGLPNLLMAFICILAAVYGIYQDWHPYSFLMAGFALFNAFVLTLSFFIGQTGWITSLKNYFLNFSLLKLNFSYKRFNRIATYTLVISPLLLLILILPSFMPEKQEILNIQFEKDFKPGLDTKDFYTGIYLSSLDQDKNVKNLQHLEAQSSHKFSIISTYLAWSDDPFPVDHWQSIINHGAIPMVTWEPWTNLFLKYADHPDLSENKKVFHHIVQGSFDPYIDDMALSLRSLGFPVFLRFAHEMDNPMYPWSHTGDNTAEEFVQAWSYIHDRFDSLGVQNVSWVWNPLSPKLMDQYFPYGKENSVNQYVDWVSFTTLNYGLASWNQKWSSFEEIYRPYNEKLKDLNINLPIMLAEFGSTSYGGNAADWNLESLEFIRKNHPEIRSLVFFYSNLDKNWITSWRPDNQDTLIDWTFDVSSIANSLDYFTTSKDSSFKNENRVGKNFRHKNIAGTYGDFSWKVDGKSFYMKGICYNPSHDWRDGFYPLTRNQLERDFQLIKDMGANTIRRYEPGLYDRNILNVAEEKDLKVLYGFWFDPAIDYYRDTKAAAAYEKKVLKFVKKHKDRKCIIGWNIGNETWGLQKKYFNKPHLTFSRRAYLEFLERLAQKIHEIDDERPVISSEEHDNLRLSGTIYEFRTHAPSIDIIGVNSYYESNISNLQQAFADFDTLRPYVVTEFGPKGYWNKELGDFNYDSLLIELSSVTKAQWYERQWKEFIEKNRGYNLGGLAFSWRDRFEGTATWFGITDYKGRLKPAYFYLKDAWTGNADPEYYFPDLYIVGHWYPVKSGESIWLAAGISNDYTGNLKYEWEVYDEKDWSRISAIENSLLKNKHVQIRMPKQKSNYRVYVYASDSFGNVITASRLLIFE